MPIETHTHTRCTQETVGAFRSCPGIDVKESLWEGTVTHVEHWDVKRTSLCPIQLEDGNSFSPNSS